MIIVEPHCASCPYEWSERYCRHDKGKAPEDCPSVHHRDLVKEAAEAMKSPEVFEFARQASIQEAEGYGFKERGYGQVRPVKPRIVEVIEFARRMHFERIALVFCVGLRGEAATVQEIFQKQGLDVLSIVCKVGRVSKELLDLTRDQQINRESFESMCNPVLQALIANRCESQLNVLLGLCVGHDSLFLQYAKAPCTVLAVKDRLLGHNPLAAVYQYNSYYRYLKHRVD
ncbi:MAG: DUF1847 domain-containing protein [Deltaproteobacteria bacterium]|nr:DUF1847 domain-containing protein [Deltaproteobacteria bacterium]